MDLRSISLFAGGGGLDLGVELACRDARTVCYVEREAYACASLVARMEEGSLAPAVVWSDVTTFDGRPWRGVVDMVVGGFPCQDISTAGKGAGLAGARSGLWFEYARILDEVQPDLVFVENVAALRSRGLDVVLGDLAALGFDAEWDCYRASDVGAPHRRERIFILAYRRGVELRDQPWWGCGPGWAGVPFVGDARPVVADDHGERRLQGIRGIQDEAGRTIAHHGGGCVADADADGSQGERGGGVLDGIGPTLGDDTHRSGGAATAVGDTEGTRLERRSEPERSGADEWAPWPPGPEELDRWREYLRLRPDAEPSVCRGAHGLAGGLVDRTDRLRLLGNGVVPQVAAVAFRELLARALAQPR